MVVVGGVAADNNHMPTYAFLSLIDIESHRNGDRKFQESSSKMGILLIEIILIFVLILANGFLAMSEIAVVSARRIRLESRAEAGDTGAQAALEMANAPSRFLSTVQVGITLIGTLAGAFGGATLAAEIEPYLIQLGLSPLHSGPISLVLVVVFITYFSLVFGELAPKQIALLDPERIASRVARPMRFFSRLAFPLVRILSFSTATLLRLLGVKPTREPAITEEEVKLLIDQGTELGVFEPIEDTIVDQVFRLGDRRVISLITPRPEIAWLDIDSPTEKILAKISRERFSHYPVARDDLDNLLGYVHSTDLLSDCIKDHKITLEKHLQEPLFVPEHLPAFEVLERFRESGKEIAFALNEYGGIEGIVTLRDILEALVGDLPEIEDLTNPSVVQREDGSWLLDGMLPIEEFRGLFDLQTLPGEQEQYFQTLGGFILNTFGRVPDPGEHFVWEGLRIEVVDMDGNRIDKVLVMPGAEQDEISLP